MYHLRINMRVPSATPENQRYPSSSKSLVFFGDAGGRNERA